MCKKRVWYFPFFPNVFGSFMPFYWEWKLEFGILSDFPGIRSLSGLNDLSSLNNLSDLDLYSLKSPKKNTELDVSNSHDTKMTYPSLIMWSGSSKIHSFIDFWQPLCGGCGEQGCLFQPNWRTIGQISTTQDLKKFNILVDPEFKNPGHTRSSRYAFEHPVMNIETKSSE